MALTKLRRAARDQSCTIRLPGCTGGGEDTVLAHLGGNRFGGGWARKSADLAGAHACDNCHAIVDGRKPRPDWLTKPEADLAHAQGCVETILRLEEQNVIAVQ